LQDTLLYKWTEIPLYFVTISLQQHLTLYLGMMNGDDINYIYTFKTLPKLMFFCLNDNSSIEEKSKRVVYYFECNFLYTPLDFL